MRSGAVLSSLATGSLAEIQACANCAVDKLFSNQDLRAVRAEHPGAKAFLPLTYFSAGH
jgi:hypothetical protein